MVLAWLGVKGDLIDGVLWRATVEGVISPSHCPASRALRLILDASRRLPVVPANLTSYSAGSKNIVRYDKINLLTYRYLSYTVVVPTR